MTLNIINSSKNYITVIFTFLLIVIYKNHKEKSQIRYNNPYKKNIILIISINLIFLLGITAFYTNSNFTAESFENLLVLVYIGILVIIFVSLLLYENLYKQLKNEYELNMKLQVFDLQQTHYNNIQETMSSLRSLRHDMNNHFIVLDGYLKQNNCEHALKYLNTITEPTINANNMVFSDNYAISALLTQKKSSCEKLGIPLLIQLDLPHIPSLEVDLCIITGNILDNAIEAVSKIPDKNKMYIEFNIKNNNSIILIECKNPFLEYPLESNGVLISQKKDSSFHGIGLKNVQTIAEKYNGTVDIIYENFIFDISATLCIT